MKTRATIKKCLSAAAAVISTFLTLIAVLLAVSLAGVRLFGLTPYVILSGSMQPHYNVGDLIYVKSIDASEIKLGDSITFVLNENLTVVTHRVVEINNIKQCFTTKGDANDSADGAPVHFNNLIGKPIFSIPYLGYVSNYFSSASGKAVGIGLILVIVLLFLLTGNQKKGVPAAQKLPKVEKRNNSVQTEKTKRGGYSF